MNELRRIRSLRDAAANGSKMDPATIANVLSLALSVIEKLLKKSAQWACVSGDLAIDTDGKLYRWNGESWKLESVGPPVSIE